MNVETVAACPDCDSTVLTESDAGFYCMNCNKHFITPKRRDLSRSILATAHALTGNVHYIGVGQLAFAYISAKEATQVLEVALSEMEKALNEPESLENARQLGERALRLMDNARDYVAEFEKGVGNGH